LVSSGVTIHTHFALTCSYSSKPRLENDRQEEISRDVKKMFIVNNKTDSMIWRQELYV